MATTYEPIATTTLGSAQPSITFSSIPSTYTDLVLIINTGFSNSGQDLLGRVNGDTGNNYSTTILRGNGSNPSSLRSSNSTNMYFDWTSITQNAINAIYIINYMDYSNTTTYKTVINTMNDANWATEANVNLWRSTAAINSILVFPSSGNFITGTTATLYGITKA